MMMPPVTQSTRALASSASARASIVRPFVQSLLHWLLTSDVAMAVKRPIKDALWRAKGRALANPPFPQPVQSLLFICQGNICRSPFAARLAQRLLTAAGRTDVVCRSAGLRTTQAAAPPAEAFDAAAAFNVSLDGHEPLQLAADLIEPDTIIVVMEAQQMAAVRATFSDAADRVVLLPLFARAGRTGYARYNIADPFGQPRATFDACYARIAEDLRELLRRADLLIEPPRT